MVYEEIQSYLAYEREISFDNRFQRFFCVNFGIVNFYEFIKFCDEQN